MKNLIYLLLICLVAPTTSFAWGKRGHQVIAETAALLNADDTTGGFLRNHSFDLGYYANVPDFVWKRPQSYEHEKNQHFMDLDIFVREFKKLPAVKQPFEMSRKDFEATFTEIKPEAGRAFWRIRELNDDLTKITLQLRELQEPTGPARQKLQEKWLVTAGVLAHYVGDLSMPLHVTENYDGQKTDQKGIHSYFEDTMVNELYPEIGAEVKRESAKQWASFKKKNAAKTPLQMLLELTDRSTKAIPALLAQDKKSKRDAIKKNAGLYHGMIRQRLVDSSLTLAEVYRRQLGWTFDGARFYFFAGEPTFMMPGEMAATQISK